MMLITLLSLLFCGWSSAETTQISVLYVSGEVQVRSQGRTFLAQKGTILGVRDEIQTTKDALALVAYPNGTRFKLDENSAVRVEGSTPPSLRLLKGATFVRVEPAQPKEITNLKTKPPARMNLRAGGVVMGVRGTEFFAAFGPGNSGGASKPQDLWMCVDRGEVEVSAPDRKQALVRAGQGIRIQAGKDLTPPQEYAWTKKLNWKMDAAEGDLKNTVRIESTYPDLLQQDYD